MAEFYITEKQAMELAERLSNPGRVYLIQDERRMEGKRLVKFGALPRIEGEPSEVVALVIVPEYAGTIWP